MQSLGVLTWGLAVVSLGAVRREVPEGAVEGLGGQEEGGSLQCLEPEPPLPGATLTPISAFRKRGIGHGSGVRSTVEVAWRTTPVGFGVIPSTALADKAAVPAPHPSRRALWAWP